MRRLVRRRSGIVEVAVVGFLVGVAVALAGTWGVKGLTPLELEPLLVLDSVTPDSWLEEVVIESRPAHTEEEAGLRRLLLMTTVVFILAWISQLASLIILQLGVASARSAEYAIRTALGTSRRRLLAAAVGVPLRRALIGGALGVAVGWLALLLLASIWPHRLAASPGTLPPAEVLLTIVLIVTLLSALTAGLPALAAWKRDAIRSGLRASGVTPSRGSGVMRMGLSIAQVAATVALFLAASVLAVGLSGSSDDVTGDGVVTVDVRIPEGADLERAVAMLNQDRNEGEAVRTLASRSAVLGLGAITVVLNECGNCFRGAMRLPVSTATVRMISVGPHFFDTAGVQIVSGREFSEADGSNGARVAIVNRTFARKHFEAGDPLGRQVMLNDGQGPKAVVIGVVEDRPAHALGLRQPVRETLYFPAFQQPPRLAEVVAAASSPDADELWTKIREAGLIPLEAPRSLARRTAHRRAPLDWLLTILAVGAVLCLAVASVGIFAVFRNFIRVRRGELAVRLALGDTTAGVSLHVGRWAARALGWGLVVGTLVASGVTPRMRVLLPSAPLLDVSSAALIWATVFFAGMLGAAWSLTSTFRVAPAEALRG